MRNLTIDSLVVHGVCPHCKQLTILVSIIDNIFKCTSCGDEVEQYVNGVIKYLPIKNRKLIKDTYGKKDK